MFETSKVLWKEGMFLQPQHFQQSERNLIDTFNDRVEALVPYAYGITDLGIDRDALANSLVTITRLSGVLPDGSTFDTPKKSLAPQPRSFNDVFTHEMQTLEVHLALPVVVLGKTNVTGQGTDGNTGIRYRQQMTTLIDEVTGAHKKEIELGSLNLQILFGTESLDNHSHITIARLVRNSTGQVVLDESFIPPLARIGASDYLLGLMRSLLELLIARITVLSQGRKQVEGGFAEFSGSEETAFRLLQTLNTYTPLLNHYHVAPHIHPFALFELLTQFTGSLCTFSSKVTIRNLPKYDHRNLNAVFSQFVAVVRSVLDADISAGSVALPIEQVRPSTYVAKSADVKLFTGAKFFFGLRASGVPEKELIVGVVRRIKICSQSKLDLLISSAMPGVQLIHTAHPPEKLSTKPDFVYFSFDQMGDLWRDIAATGVIAFYFPHTYSELQMEIIALKQ